MIARLLAFVGLLAAAYAVALLGFSGLALTPGNLTMSGIPGGSERVGREGTSDIFGVGSRLSRAFDPRTGQPVAGREHGPLIVLKLIDRASPLLHKAWASGQGLPSVTLDWYRIDPQTREEEGYYVITLTKARVVAMTTFMPLSFLPANEAYRHMEQVSFNYQGVEWQWLPDSIATRDRLIDGPPADADSDNDLRIDLRDVGAFQRCVPMPSAGWFECDDAFDFNSDYAVDAGDWPEVFLRLTGP
jgi:type VI secretion system secreted protein Hcp